MCQVVAFPHLGPLAAGAEQKPSALACEPRLVLTAGDLTSGPRMDAYAMAVAPDGLTQSSRARLCV